MRSLVIVVPQELLQSAIAGFEGKKPAAIEAFVVDGAKEAFDFAIALRGIGAEQAVFDAQAVAELLKTGLALAMKGELHREHPSVVGHDGLDAVRQAIQDTFEKLAGRTRGLFGGDPGDGLAGEVIDGSEFEVVTGIS